MPREVGSVINSALGAGRLEIGWVQRWFDWWFLGSVVVTAGGIWVGRVVGGSGAGDWGEGWDDDGYGYGGGGVELGKRS